MQKCIKTPLMNPWQIDPMQPDHDLWEVFQQCVRPVADLVSFHKVCSHQQSSKLDAIEQWICEGNNHADVQAGVALEQLPPEVRHYQSRVAEQIRWVQTASDQMIQHMVRVGNIFTQQKPTNRQETTPTVPSQEVDEVPIDTKQVVQHMQDGLPQSFSFKGVHKWFEWFAAVTDPQAAPKWVTWHELLISYQLTTGERGLFCKSVTQGNHRQWEQMNLRNEYDFPEVSRAFGHFCMQIIKRTHPTWKSSMRRPHNWRFQMWCGCVYLRFSTVKDAAVQSWFKEQVASSTFSSVKDMAKLPQAADLEVVSKNRTVGLWRFAA